MCWRGNCKSKSQFLKSDPDYFYNNHHFRSASVVWRSRYRTNQKLSTIKVGRTEIYASGTSMTGTRGKGIEAQIQAIVARFDQKYETYLYY